MTIRKPSLLQARPWSLMLLLLLGGLLVAVMISTAQTAHAEYAQCIQAIKQWYGETVFGAITMNPQTGQSTVEHGLIITPAALFSPDGKYAAFWQALDGENGEVGLYIAAVSGNHVALVDKKPSAKDTDWFDLDSDKYWSPDSHKIAYVNYEDKQPLITVFNADGSNKQTKAIRPKLVEATPRGEIVFLGWSADSRYIAASIREEHDTNEPNTIPQRRYELQVWLGSDLTEISPGILLGAGTVDYRAYAIWSPTGHRLAMQVANLPGVDAPKATEAPLAIWSPDKGFEAKSLGGSESIPTGEDDGYNMLFWSPDGQHVRLNITGAGGGFSQDYIFGVRGAKLVRPPGEARAIQKAAVSRESLDIREFIAWLPGGAALMLDTTYSGNDDTHPRELYWVDPRVGIHKTIGRDAYADRNYVSNDGHYAAIWLKDRTGLLNLQTLKQTDFKKSEWGGALWSPNGKYVAFGFYPFGQGFEKTDFIIDRATFKTIDLKVNALSWLDDHWIVYEVERNGQHQIEVRDLITNVVQPITDFHKDYGSQALDLIAALSPDQQMIAGTQNLNSLTLVGLKDGKRSVYKVRAGYIDVSRGGAHWGTDQSGLRYSLVWSPQSDLLAFREGSGFASDLVVINRDGKEVSRTALADNSGVLRWVPCTTGI